MAVCALSGCDEVEPIPSYLHISQINLDVESNGSQGSDAHDIVDAWVYVGSQFVGVFEIPATIPVLAQGKQTVTVVPGIKKNGINKERVPYPFYKPYTQERELIPSQIDSLNIRVAYADNVQFPWLEDFEDKTISMQRTGSSTTTDSLFVTEQPSEVYAYDGIRNKASGKVIIPQGFQIFESGTVQLYDLPRRGAEIYLELNFKCNTEFVVGMYPIDGSAIEGFPVVNFFSTEDENGDMQWKKAYVSLKEDVNATQYAGADFRVFFNAQTNVETGNPLLFFDNIKLAHF